jgi:hypothetical protein
VSKSRVSLRTGFKRRFQELPHFGIFGSVAVFCAVVGVWVATAIGNPEPKGFHVRLLLPIAQKQAFDPWLQPIVIRVDAEARYYLDGDAIPVRRLPKALTAFFLGPLPLKCRKKRKMSGTPWTNLPWCS